MSEFQNKVVVVTGGNSGIGLACAKSFADLGAKIVIMGRNQETLSATKEKLGDNCLVVKGDVSKVEDIERLYQKTTAVYGQRIDIVVANSGIGARKLLTECSEEDFNSMFDINAKGAFFTVQKAVPYLGEGSSVILISSIAAHTGVLGQSIYSGTKAAVSKFAQIFALELCDKGIRVNAVSPGLIKTPIWDYAEQADPEIFNQGGKKIPLWNRFAEPEEIASTVKFLASKDAIYITGQDIVVDAGITHLRKSLVYDE